jgi:hypothetical protein
MALAGGDASRSGVFVGRRSTGAGPFEEVPFDAFQPIDGTAANVLAQPYRRSQVASSTLTAPATGVLQLHSIYLPAGLTVSAVTWFSGTTAANTPLNQIFSLYSSARVLLAQSADDTTGAWAANAAKRLPFTSAYTTVAGGLYYVGLLVVATAVPTLAGVAAVATGPRNIGFISGGASTGSLTDTLPDPADAITASGTSPYFELS